MSLCRRITLITLLSASTLFHAAGTVDVQFMNPSTANSTTTKRKNHLNWVFSISTSDGSPKSDCLVIFFFFFCRQLSPGQLSSLRHWRLAWPRLLDWFPSFTWQRHKDVAYNLALEVLGRKNFASSSSISLYHPLLVGHSLPHAFSWSSQSHYGC